MDLALPPSLVSSDARRRRTGDDDDDGGGAKISERRFRRDDAEKSTISLPACEPTGNGLVLCIRDGDDDDGGGACVLRSTPHLAREVGLRGSVARARGGGSAAE